MMYLTKICQCTADRCSSCVVHLELPRSRPTRAPRGSSSLLTKGTSSGYSPQERSCASNSQKIVELQNTVTESGRLLEAEKQKMNDLKTRSYLLKKDVEQARRVGVKNPYKKETRDQRESRKLG